jgi:chaperone modulatory protein CbpM
MSTDDVSLVHIGTVIEEDSLSLGQLCRACAVHADWVINLVEEGIIEPDGDKIQVWRFSGASLIRVHSAVRLQRDLGVNLAGIALILDLLEELKSLRTHSR